MSLVKKILQKTLLPLSLSALISCSFSPSSDNNSPSGNSSKPSGYDYTTTVKLIASKNIDPSGGVLEVTNQDSFIQGTKLTVPPNILTNQTLTMGEVNNPPALPSGLNYVGVPIDLGPDGLNFNSPLTINIPYHDESLSDAGISEDTNLKLYYYNKSSDHWDEVNITSVDRVNNIITAEINHFSYYAVTGTAASPPEDLGNPQPGDLLYTLGTLSGDNLPLPGWYPGHVGIYVGEKIYNGIPYNVIEAKSPVIIRTNYNPISKFSGANIYMGARESKDVTLTSEQRSNIVNYVESQIGKEYAWLQTMGSAFGMLPGSAVKGPDKFNCVGLAEKAYEEAGVNGG